MKTRAPFLMPGGLLLLTSAAAFLMPRLDPSFADQSKLIPNAIGGVLLVLGLGFAAFGLGLFRERHEPPR